MIIAKHNTVTGLNSTITEREFLRLKSPYMEKMGILKKTGSILIGDIVYRIAEEQNAN